jgi:AraC-like DNA-binding protein
MEQEIQAVQSKIQHAGTHDRMQHTELFPGITLSFLTLTTDKLAVQHDALDDILEVNYCKRGRIGWKLGTGHSVYLGPGDISLHTMKTCADSVLSLPNGSYEGLTLFIDLRELTNNPPELLSGTGITGELLYEKFCTQRPFVSFAGNHTTADIFEGFYDQPDALRTACWKVKALEVLLYLAKLTPSQDDYLTEYRSEQVETVREIHRYLMEHLDQRFTIEELSKQYLMSATTLKSVFKSVYGTSISAHIKTHRMEAAAQLLREGALSLSEIAAKVGYTNQSKFSAAFKQQFGLLPREYRKQAAAVSLQGAE